MVKESRKGVTMTILITFKHRMGFKSLVSAVSEQCQEIKQALSSFPYFNSWNENTIAECCRVASVMEFPPDKIILGSDPLDVHSTYFILEGTCLMVYFVQVYVTTKSNGEKRYRLYKPTQDATVQSENNISMYSSALFNEKLIFQNKILKEIPADEIVEPPEKNSRGDEQEKEQNEEGAGCFEEPFVGEETDEISTEVHDYPEEGNDVDDEEKNTASDGKAEVDNAVGVDDNGDDEEEMEEKNFENLKETEIVNEKVEEEKEMNDVDNEEDDIEQDEEVNTSEEKETGNEIIQTIEEKKDKTGALHEKKQSEPETEVSPGEVKVKTYEPDFHLKVLKECREKSSSVRKMPEEPAGKKWPKGVERIFVQTGILLKGACFGLEKEEKEFFVTSRGPVKCLRIPRMFLFQHNFCNVWDRILLFDRLYLAKGEKILQNVITQRKWTEMKKREIEKMFRRNGKSRGRESDVPISVRIGLVPETF